jgi:nucleoside-diphosphate-sugar epimerase
MRVFVTGHLGYIGPHLVRILKEAGHYVTGCDLGLFDGCQWEPLPRPDRDLRCDVRVLKESDLAGHDAVCHLAAISNDPMGALNPQITLSINRDASVRLARLAKAAGVRKYLFSSSCSVYGKGEKLDLTEDDPLCPLTAYAQSKIQTEQQVAELADANFCPIFLRNATAYGHSPMLRIDLVVNNLLACGVTSGRIDIHSDGSPWRPLIHCEDIARAFLAMLDAPPERVSGKAINIGANEENYRVRDVADRVQSLLPGASINYTGQVGDDPRNYRVNFDKLAALLPDFKLKYDLTRGMHELFDTFREHHFSQADFEGPQFVRLRMLQTRLERIDPTHRQAVA